MQIQDEGMGITNFVADADDYDCQPALHVNNPAVSLPLALVADSKKGDASFT